MLNNVSINNAHQLNIKSILLDFDGVIASESTKILCDTCYQFISEHIHIEYVVFSDMFRTFMPFPLSISKSAILKATGLEDLGASFIERINSVSADISGATFCLDFCRKKDIPVYVFSTGDGRAKKYDEIKSMIDPDYIVIDPGLSKLVPSSYTRLFHSKNINPQECLVIDDSYAALGSAKHAGAITGLMKNSMNCSDCFDKYSAFIDYIFDDLDQLTEYL